MAYTRLGAVAGMAQEDRSDNASINVVKPTLNIIGHCMSRPLENHTKCPLPYARLSVSVT